VQTDAGVDCDEGMIYEELQERATMFESEEFPGQQETDVIVFADPRTRYNGVKILCAEGSFELEDTDIKVYD